MTVVHRVHEQQREHETEEEHEERANEAPPHSTLDGLTKQDHRGAPYTLEFNDMMFCLQFV